MALSANKRFLNFFANMSIDSDEFCSSTTRLFYVTGLDTAKSRRPMVVLVRGTTSVPLSADRSCHLATTDETRMSCVNDDLTIRSWRSWNKHDRRSVATWSDICLVSTIPLPFFRCRFTVPVSRFRTPLPLHAVADAVCVGSSASTIGWPATERNNGKIELDPISMKERLQ